MQKLDDELHRSVVVVMKDYLEVAGFGVNIGHWIVSLISIHFGTSLWISARSLERTKNNVTTLTCKNIKRGQAAGAPPFSRRAMPNPINPVAPSCDEAGNDLISPANPG